jgi:hypothetical protein
MERGAMQNHNNYNTYHHISFAVAVIAIIILGFIDYFSGDYSIDVLYVVVIFAVSWYTNIWYGVLCLLESVGAEIVSDYYLKNETMFSLKYIWNMTSDTIIFIFTICTALLIRNAYNKKNK